MSCNRCRPACMYTQILTRGFFSSSSPLSYPITSECADPSTMVTKKSRSLVKDETPGPWPCSLFYFHSLGFLLRTNCQVACAWRLASGELVLSCPEIARLRRAARGRPRHLALLVAQHIGYLGYMLHFAKLAELQPEARESFQ